MSKCYSIIMVIPIFAPFLYCWSILSNLPILLFLIHLRLALLAKFRLCLLNLFNATYKLILFSLINLIFIPISHYGRPSFLYSLLHFVKWSHFLCIICKAYLIICFRFYFIFFLWIILLFLFFFINIYIFLGYNFAYIMLKY